jgi:ABC-type glycerol-3-phosphate transport system substrate-binding protein
MKRSLVIFVALLVFGLVGACQVAQPAVVEREVVVEKVVTVEVEKEVEVEKVVTVEVEKEVEVGGILSGPGYRPYEGKTLRILGFGGVPQFQYQAQLLHPQYEDISGVEVIFEDTPYPELFPKIQAMCASESDDYDIYYLEETFQGKMVDELDCAERLEPWFMQAPGDIHPEDYSLQTFSQMAMYKDQWVGLPGNHAVGIMAYRQDLFEDPEYQAEYQEMYGTELKVPEDWDELLQVAQFFTRDTDGDGENDLWGVNHRYGEANNIFSDWLIGFANSRGLRYWDENYNPMFNSVEAIESAEFFLSPEYLATQPPGAESYQFQEVMQNMSQGRVAMYITENWSIPLLKDPGVTPYAEQIAFAAIPGWRDPETGEIHRGTMSAGIGYGINKNISDEQKQIAWDFLQFAYGKTLSRPFTYQTGVSIRISGHTDPDLVEKWPHLPANLEQMKAGVPRPKDPWWEQALFALGTELSAALIGDKSVEEALNVANEEVGKIIEDAGYYEEGKTYIDKDQIDAFGCAKYAELGLEHEQCQ